jgi:putative sterol carrier protein
MGASTMIDRDELLNIVKGQAAKFMDERISKAFKKWNKTMEYFFTDIEEYYKIVLVNGEPVEVSEGKAEKADIKYEMSTETFYAIVKKELSGMKAYNQKKVKVKGPMSDLMKLQKLEKV